MKNIHILPTDKPSRVFITKDEGLGFDNQMLENTELDCQNQNIYITSEEEIKEGDWVLLPKYTVYPYNNIKKMSHSDILDYLDSQSLATKKIILTTNQDLINDGIQAIDDEFLEWFVKNPSCEEIKVEVVDDNIQWYKIIMSNKVFTPIYNHVEFINDNIDEFDEKIKEFKHEFKVLTTKEVMEGRSSAYNFIDFGKIETLEDIKLEEVVGTKHCRYSVIENKLSALYRNQEQILKAIKMLNHRR